MRWSWKRWERRVNSEKGWWRKRERESGRCWIAVAFGVFFEVEWSFWMVFLPESSHPLSSEVRHGLHFIPFLNLSSLHSLQVVRLSHCLHLITPGVICCVFGVIASLEAAIHSQTCLSVTENYMLLMCFTWLMNSIWMGALWVWKTKNLETRGDGIDACCRGSAVQVVQPSAVQPSAVQPNAVQFLSHSLYLQSIRLLFILFFFHLVSSTDRSVSFSSHESHSQCLSLDLLLAFFSHSFSLNIPIDVYLTIKSELDSFQV